VLWAVGARTRVKLSLGGSFLDGGTRFAERCAGTSRFYTLIRRNFIFCRAGSFNHFFYFPLLANSETGRTRIKFSVILARADVLRYTFFASNRTLRDDCVDFAGLGY